MLPVLYKFSFDTTVDQIVLILTALALVAYAAYAGWRGAHGPKDHKTGEFGPPTRKEQQKRAVTFGLLGLGLAGVGMWYALPPSIIPGAKGEGIPVHLRLPLFHLVTLAAIVLITWYFRKLKGAPDEKWAVIGLPLMLGGAIGNYIDRIARAFVIDFIEAHWFDKAHWPSFNIADMALVVGVGCLIVDAFVRKEDKAPKKSSAPA